MGFTDEFTFYTDSKPPAAAIQGLRPQKDNKKNGFSLKYTVNSLIMELEHPLIYHWSIIMI